MWASLLKYAPNCQKVIDDIVFSGRAIDGMKEIGISIESVKNTIEKNDVVQHDHFSVYSWQTKSYSDRYKVVSDEKGKVLFILR